MDALSDVLKSVRLEGAMYVNAEFTAPWCVTAAYGLDGVRRLLPSAERVVFFHFLTEGTCKVRLIADGQTETLVKGDLVLLSQDSAHLLGSDFHIAPVDGSIQSMPKAVRIANLSHGGGGAVTRFVCGYIACSRSVCRLLFDALPSMLRVSLGESPASTMLRDLINIGVRESAAARPGAESLLAKLSELMFVEAMRHYIASLPPDGKGWLAGVRDPQIGKALALLHGEPTRGWTVDELGRAVALSRSTLSERFTELVGEPPMQYLTRWRLALAAQSLRTGAEAITRVAEHAGYESEAAFSRAFKREFGLPPATWRRAERV